ncbi:MAG: DUF4277 domain-containing protein [Candidatus Binatia bacterium]
MRVAGARHRRWPSASAVSASINSGRSLKTCRVVSPKPLRFAWTGCVERQRRFGDVWLGLMLWQALQLDTLCAEVLPVGHENVPWSLVAAILVIARLCEPSSELYVAERWYERTALEDLLGVAAERINEDRLYRLLDHLVWHKSDIEHHLRNRLGELFAIDYDLLLYDVTSTYFEGWRRATRWPGVGIAAINAPTVCRSVSRWW